MPNEEEEADKAVRTWIESESADDVADCAMRGRKFASFSEPELTEAWVLAFRNAANNIHEKQLRDTQIDFASEFWLRGLEPPYDSVRDDLNKLTESVKKWMA